ncbi:hypothetical protein B0H11DRAFT_2192641 [Mycena galericulata]|nr:hypothetical protein B0H11DRAFT_2192641 [Mycena galericulata]
MNDDSEAEISFGRRTSPGNCIVRKEHRLPPLQTTIPSPHNSTVRYRSVIASLCWEDLGHTSRILWLAQRTAGSQAVKQRTGGPVGKHGCLTGKLGAYYRRLGRSAERKITGCQQPKVSRRLALELQLLHVLPDLVVKPTSWTDVVENRELNDKQKFENACGDISYIYTCTSRRPSTSHLPASPEHLHAPNVAAAHPQLLVPLVFALTHVFACSLLRLHYERDPFLSSWLHHLSRFGPQPQYRLVENGLTRRRSGSVVNSPSRTSPEEHDTLGAHRFHQWSGALDMPGHRFWVVAVLTFTIPVRTFKGHYVLVSPRLEGEYFHSDSP